MKKITALLACSLFFGATIQNAFAQSCGTRQLDSRVASFLKMIGYQDMTIEQLRKLPIEKIKFPFMPFIPYPKEDVQRIKITADSIPVLVFNPAHASNLPSNLPVIIHYHGGGFISPLVLGLERALWQDAKTYGAIVFAVDYSVAPENKFPAAVNDSYYAFKWIAAHAAEFGGDTNRIVLTGNSAGANLVAVITHKAKKEGLAKKIKLQVLNGLPADLRPQHMETSPSYQQNTTGYFQTKAACYFAVENYAPGQYDNPQVSPLLNEDLSGLPPAVIINAEFDPLRDDGGQYAARLRMAGVQVWDKCFAGQIHMLLGLPPDAEEIKQYQTMVKNAMEVCLPN